MPKTLRHLRALVYLVVPTILACKSGGDGPVGTTAGYALSAAPATISVTQGTSGTVAIGITRTGGFVGPVTLAATGTSAGLTAAFNPNSTAGNTSTLTLTAAAGATTGTVTVTITGTAPPLANQTTTLQVTVTAATGGTAVTQDYTGCGPFLNPVWFAFQDGDGPWRQVIPTGAVYRFNITSAKGGYAIATVSGANTNVTVRMVAAADLAGRSGVFCPPQVFKTVNVPVSGLTGTEIAFISLGGGTVFAQSSTLNPVPITGVQAGLQDLVSYKVPSGVGGPTAADRSIIIRDLNIPDNGSTATLDWVSGPLITPTAATITVAGLLAGDLMSGSMSYFTGTGPACTLAALYGIPPSTASARVLFGIPALSQRPTDFHFLSLTERNGSNTRSIGQSFHTFANQTITMGANVPTPTITALAQAGYKRLQAVGTIPVDYPTEASLTYTQQGTGKSAGISGTMGWIGGANATLAFPDFSAVGGWQDAWAPAPASTVDWLFMATDFNYTGLPCSEGGHLRAGRVSGVK
ncbi:MAG TPA: hypothetical protein VHE78_02285 [Gemmatimonadaceae bacterium]|nr:hypothetical protein [Gemmatimonadaceae bacterium]